MSIADVERPERDGLWIEMTLRESATPVTMMVTYADVPLSDGVSSNAVALNWFNPATRQVQRTETESEFLPPHFGAADFFAGLRDTRILAIAPALITEMYQMIGTNAETRLTPDNAAFQTLAVLFEDFQAERVEALVAESLDKYGLKDPACTIRLNLISDLASPQRVLLIGAEVSQGQRYAMVKGQDSVFVLSEPATQLLMMPFRNLTTNHTN